MKLKLIISTLLLAIMGYSQCPPSGDLELKVVEQFPANGLSIQVLNPNSSQYDCNTTFNASNILTDQTFLVKINSLSNANYATNGYILTIDNGLSGGFSIYNNVNTNAITNIPISIATPGLHDVKIQLQLANGCGLLDVLLEDVEIKERNCPYVRLIKESDYNPCYSTSNDGILVELAVADQTATIQATTWNVLNEGIYTGYGNTFHFDPPSSGFFEYTATVEILKSNGTVCVSDLGGPSCLFNFKEYYFVDPYFETQGSLITNSPISAIYLGNPSNPSVFSQNDFTFKLNGTTISPNSPLNPKYSYNQAFHTFPNLPVGTHNLQLIYNYIPLNYEGECRFNHNIKIKVEDVPPPPPPCEICLPTFRPIEGEKYWIGGWVNEDFPNHKIEYLNSAIELEFYGSGSNLITSNIYYPSGDMVEDWQRIIGTFTVPIGTIELKIKLRNSNGQYDSYFDDIRIHPFNGSMKSYVYDPTTFWLTAELDDNNFATFYEYDNEGQLVRIKKETTRGIMTIQESRSANPKKQ